MDAPWAVHVDLTYPLFSIVYMWIDQWLRDAEPEWAWILHEMVLLCVLYGGGLCYLCMGVVILMKLFHDIHMCVH